MLYLYFIKLSALCLVFLITVINVSGVAFVKNENLDEGLQIRTANGVVQGGRGTSFRGRLYWSYKGIPYGRPPVGSLRFRAPRPAGPWQGVLDATLEGPTCVEILVRASGIFSTGTEDCLIVNVFTPVEPKSTNKSLPVMVWFYGGAFVEGNSSGIMYGPEFLLDEDIVAVTLNYRIGVFGFLSTEDSASPGNYGLKDQHLALLWVRKNIEKFGGDPNQVTLYGQSAGASSVFYHMVSQKSRGLFHRAIANSGTSISSFARKIDARDIAFKVGTGVGITTRSSKELVTKLRKVSLEKLIIVSRRIMALGLVTLIQQGYPFGPVIEYEHKDAFVSESTYALLEVGNFSKVPVLTGITTAEAVFFKNLIKMMKPLSIVFDLSPGSLPNAGMNIKSFEKRSEAGKDIKNHYFRHGSAYEASVDQVEKFLSDDQFVRPLRKTVQLLYKYVPVYSYMFSYTSAYGVRGYNKIKRSGKGVAHIEDLSYIWKRSDRPFPTDSKDKVMVSRMVTLWTNFVRNGNPTPQKDQLLDNITWAVVDSSTNIKYLNIDHTLSVKSNFRGADMKFWDYLFEKYGGGSYVTY